MDRQALIATHRLIAHDDGDVECFVCGWYGPEDDIPVGCPGTPEVAL